MYLERVCSTLKIANQFLPVHYITFRVNDRDCIAIQHLLHICFLSILLYNVLCSVNNNASHSTIK